nr:macro domain-containing protein [Bacillus sp. ISL-77]
MLQNSLQLAAEKGLKSIVFPSISTGIFRFPIELASNIALKTIIDFLKTNPFGDVAMVLFSQDDYRVYQTSLDHILTKDVISK